MNLDFALAPATDPISLFRYRDGIYAVDLLGAAVIHLNFFTWLSRQPADIATICREFDFKERPADVMLTLFAAMELVEPRDGVFHTTELADEFFVDGSQWSLRPYYGSLKDRPVCHDFLRVLRTGKPANWGSGQSDADWHKSMENDSFARSFTDAMDCRGVLMGRALAAKLDLRGQRRLLDIAGGSGIYACAIAAAHPHLNATVFEKPPVDRIVSKLIAERGFSERINVVSGEMFHDVYPGDCDVHLLSNVLHDWDVAEVRALVAKSAQALPPGGMVIVHDMFLNRDKTGPLPVANYSCILMHSTQGRIYSVGEMEFFLTEAGFQDCQYFPTAVDRGAMTARKAVRRTDTTEDTKD